MNLRNWNINHTKGLLIGLITPLLFVPVVLLLIGWTQDYQFAHLWAKFSHSMPYRIKIMTISIIANLIWFYVFLNREKWNMAMGIIVGTLVYAPYIVYIKFF
jgi:hypothetical protein